MLEAPGITAELRRPPADAAEVLARWPADRPLCVLHSGRWHPRWARFTLVAAPAGAAVFDDRGGRVVGEVPTGPVRDATLADDLFAALDAGCDDAALWVVSIGYDAGRRIESLPAIAPDDRPWPVAFLQRCPRWWVHDALNGRWYARGSDGVGELADVFGPPRPLDFRADALQPAAPRERFEADVQRVRAYIAAGDVFQVNLAQRLSAAFTGDPRGLSVTLMQQSPSWYAAHVEPLPGVLRGSDATPPGRRGHGACRAALVSCSPELFLDVRSDGRVITRPIKGTRPASADPAELLASPKDAAELAMIVDLLRNDLGRVCGFGSIVVEQARELERHPTVLHGTATIRGRLREGVGLGALLQATLPPGSITGAPKVRAMAIIDELEPARRGPYCGVLGWVHGGHGAFNVAIRTALVAEGNVDVWVGGGVVADSDPAAEYEETMTKAAALRAALRGGGAASTPRP